MWLIFLQDHGVLVVVDMDMDMTNGCMLSLLGHSLDRQSQVASQFLLLPVKSRITKITNWL